MPSATLSTYFTCVVGVCVVGAKDDEQLNDGAELETSSLSVILGYHYWHLHCPI